RKLLRLQSQFLKKCKARERIERAKRRMVLDMLRQSITLEKYKEIYSSRYPADVSAEASAKGGKRDPDLSAHLDSGFRRNDGLAMVAP
ncbi:MAG: hypothetical protein DI586_06265, partial [Micavibrio aeruginosavorus]